MNYSLNDRESCTLYYLPKKLKWWQKILQKLHIKDYYKRIVVASEIPYEDNYARK